MADKANLLVVDDEQGMCNLLKKIIEAEGYKVTEATSGEDAISVVKKGNIDLVVMDVIMPGIGGMGALRKIKKINEDIPVIMITGYASVKIASESMKSGAIDYISKPFDNKYLISLIKEALELIKK